MFTTSCTITYVTPRFLLLSSIATLIAEISQIQEKRRGDSESKSALFRNAFRKSMYTDLKDEALR
jgi:hypothetical protein